MVQGSDLSAMRVVVVGVTPAALARDPGAQLRRIELAHADARRTGTRAPVTATRATRSPSLAPADRDVAVTCPMVCVLLV